jgi:hypothetical protein
MGGRVLFSGIDGRAGEHTPLIELPPLAAVEAQ